MHPVEIADLRRAFEAAREFTLYVGPTDDDAKRSVTLRTPTDHQVRIAGLRAGVAGQADPAALALLERALLELAVIGWSGMRQSDAVPTASADPMDFAPELVGLLLDARPDWFREATSELFQRLAARSTARADAAKN